MFLRFILFISALFLLNQCVKEKTISSPHFQAIGTTAQLTLTIGHQDPYTIIGKAMETIKILGKRLNRYDPASEVSAFNLGSATLPVSEDLYHAIVFSKSLCEQTDGLFDITVLPLVEIWDFKKGIVPSDAQIKKAKSQIGCRYLKPLAPIMGNHKKPERWLIEKNKQVRIDLGGIGKGFIIDEVRRLLLLHEVKAGIIEIGGDLLAFGREWNIGIKDPKTKKPLYSLTIKDQAVVTSGDYERFFEKEGRLYSHIIDPRSGKPAEVTAHSITVIGTDIKIALALAKAFFILGPEGSFYLEQRFPDYAYFFIQKDQTLKKSINFPYLIKKIPGN